jgi:hypothetical protein
MSRYRWRSRDNDVERPLRHKSTKAKRQSSQLLLLHFVQMAYNSGGANPIGAKTGPRPEDAYVPPVNKETLDSIESKADSNTEKGETKREGVVGTLAI